VLWADPYDSGQLFAFEGKHDAVVIGRPRLP
jgi:hypothetical protein